MESLSRIQTSDPEKIKSDQAIANHLSTVIENTAFLADLVLHFPKLYNKLASKNMQWIQLVQSAAQLTLRTELVDDLTLKAINLVTRHINPDSSLIRFDFKCLVLFC